MYIYILTNASNLTAVSLETQVDLSVIIFNSIWRLLLGPESAVACRQSAKDLGLHRFLTTSCAYATETILPVSIFYGSAAKNNLKVKIVSKRIQFEGHECTSLNSCFMKIKS
jgi:hypothetical protein